MLIQAIGRSNVYALLRVAAVDPSTSVPSAVIHTLPPARRLPTPVRMRTRRPGPD